jgi:O-antigen ligase
LLDAAGRFPQIYLPLIGVGIAAMWPLTAYALSPLLLPAAVLLGAIVLTVLRRPEYGLALAVAITPLTGLEIGQPLGASVSLPREPFRVLLPLIVFGVLLYGAVLQGPDRRKLPAVFVGITLLIGAALISSFQALEPSESVADVFLLLTASALFVAILNTCRRRDQLLVVVAGALFALLIASVHGVVQHFEGVFSTQGFVFGGENVGRVQGAFGHPNEYAGFLAMLLPLAVAIAATKGLPLRLRLLAGVAALAAVPALNYSYARTAIATLLLGALIWLLIMRPKLAAVTAVVVAVGAISFVPGVLKERFSPESAEEDVALRTDVAQSAFDIYSEHPLLGVGVNNFQTAYSERLATETAGQGRLLHKRQLLVPTAAPSQYLNTLAEQGLFGLGALAIFVLLALRSAWRVSKARDPAVRGLGLGIGMAVAAVVLNSLAQISLQEVQVMILFTLLGIATTAESAFPWARQEPEPSGEFGLARHLDGGAWGGPP